MHIICNNWSVIFTVSIQDLELTVGRSKRQATEGDSVSLLGWHSHLVTHLTISHWLTLWIKLVARRWWGWSSNYPHEQVNREVPWQDEAIYKPLGDRSQLRKGRHGIIPEYSRISRRIEWKFEESDSPANSQVMYHPVLLHKRSRTIPALLFQE